MKISEIEEVLEKIKKEHGDIDFDTKFMFTVNLCNKDAVTFCLDVFKHFKLEPNAVMDNELWIYFNDDVIKSLNKKIHDSLIDFSKMSKEGQQEILDLQK